MGLCSKLVGNSKQCLDYLTRGKSKVGGGLAGSFLGTDENGPTAELMRKDGDQISDRQLLCIFLDMFLLAHSFGRIFPQFSDYRHIPDGTD